MRRLKTSVLIMFLLLLASASRLVFSRLPMPPAGLASEKYAGFSGVLQIWYDENLSESLGSIAAWINGQASVFEKNNAGVYVRLTAVSPDQLTAAATAAQPPDMVLFSPGSVGASGLLPLEGEHSLLPAFRRAGHCDGMRLAEPLAAGGYLFAANGELPDSLSELPDASVGLPEGGELTLVALCERFAVQRTGEHSIAAPDIGLTASATPEPTLPPVEGTSLRAANLRTGESDALYAALLNGELRALALNQRQVVRVRAGQANGKYGGVRLLNAAGYTDQLLLAAIVDTKRDDLSERAGLCEDFIALLLSDAAQSRLTACDLFSVTLTDALYGGVSGMNQIEAALRRSDCVVRGAFEPPLTIDLNALLDGTRSARELMRDLRNSR